MDSPGCSFKYSLRWHIYRGYRGTKEHPLQKLFSTFPGEWPGVGLVLLRALVGFRLGAQGVAYLQSSNQGLVTWALAALAFTSGLLLLAGLMTPLVAAIVAFGGVAIALSWIPLPTQDFFNSNFAVIDLIASAISIAFLGPGAFSLDARMFGRREITIPSRSHASRS